MSGELPADLVETYLGSDITYDYEKPGHKTRHVEGVVTAVERAPGRITNDRGQWPCFRLRIKPHDGSRAIWTCAFPDESPREVPHV